MPAISVEGNNSPFSWRMGVNMREFAYYGTNDNRGSNLIPTRTDLAFQETQLAELKQMGVRLVRFYGSYYLFEPEDCRTRVKSTLDVLKKFGMQGIVCLNDCLNSGFTVRGEENEHGNGVNFHTEQGHLNKDYWSGGYEQYYLKQLQVFLKDRRLRDHPALFMWELGNEYAIHPPLTQKDNHFDSFLRFVQRASGLIKGFSPTRNVSIGLVNTHQIAAWQGSPAKIRPLANQFYALKTEDGQFDAVDAISLHFYVNDQWFGEAERTYAEVDIKVASRLTKPFYIGELGVYPDGNGADRAEAYRKEIQVWRDKGAFTAMLWGFDTSQSGIATPDKASFSRANPDYSRISDVVKAFAPQQVTPV